MRTERNSRCSNRDSWSAVSRHQTAETFLIDDDDPYFRACIDDRGADPFCERPRRLYSLHRQLLGGYFHFESDSEALLNLVAAAYDNLPSHRFSDDVPTFHIALRLLRRPAPSHTGEPPPMRTQSGAGMLCGVMDACNYVLLSPERRRGLIVASEDMLSRPYHLRYEFIEFAVFTLAARGLGLVPLHGACVGTQGRGILLLGASGSGKSTAALHGLLEGLDFLAEDAVFVQPESLLATGIANYLHVQRDALRFVDDEQTQRWIGAAPIIRRRSGVEKHEADLRHGSTRLAPMPLKLVGTIFVSSRMADDPETLLIQVSAKEAATRLVADQAYASGQPGWREFESALIRQGVYELRRGRHPRASVDALRGVLG